MAKVLRPTGCCSQPRALWQELRGRRFGCQKQRRDTGSSGKGWRLQGSFKAVRDGQHAAADALVALAEADLADPTAAAARTVPLLGGTRQQVAQRARQHPVIQPSKKLANFRLTTMRRLAEKKKVPVWRGHGADPPKLRLGGGAVSVVAPTAAACNLALQALWAGSRRRRPGAPATTRGQAKARPRTTSSGAPAAAQGSGGGPSIRLDVTEGGPGDDETAPKYKILLALDRLAAASAANRVAVVVVPSKDDLVRAEHLSHHLLHAWLGIIALGAAVVSSGQPQDSGDVYDRSAWLNGVRKVFFSERFATRHKRLMKAFVGITGRKGCKWQVSAAAGQGVTQLDELDDLRRFLLNARRYAEGHRTAGRYDASAVEAQTERATRYGRLVKAAPDGPLAATQGQRLQAASSAATR